MFLFQTKTKEACCSRASVPHCVSVCLCLTDFSAHIPEQCWLDQVDTPSESRHMPFNLEDGSTLVIHSEKALLGRTSG